MNLIDRDKMIGNRLPRWLIEPAARWMEIDWFNQSYRSALEAYGRPDAGNCFETMLDEWKICYDVVAGDRSLIPKDGPVLLVSNHPFGAVDSLILSDLAIKSRSDSLVLANYLLAKVPELTKYLIELDPFGGSEAKRLNVRGIRQALSHLKQGGLVGIFPAGEVASFQLREMRVAEREWSPLVIHLARQSGAGIVPVHFEGANGPVFHACGLIHPMLRTASLIRETKRSVGAAISVRIGRPIKPSELPGKGREAAKFLQKHVERLGKLSAAENRWQRGRDGERRSPSQLEEIAEATPLEQLANEVEGLSADNLLVERGEWKVFLAGAHEIPNCLREIGRLREITFRGVGEGTGKALDLDRYDEWYLHLFLWNSRVKQIAGSYRFGPTEEILPKYGLDGLYTHSLFRYRSDFFEKTGPVLEVGRSFVVEEFQRGFWSLSLLWKGIGAFLKRFPQYRYAVGPVSISSSYQMISRQLMMRFLRRKFWSSKHSRMVKSATPPDRRDFPRFWSRAHLSKNLDTIGEVNGAVSAIEHDGKGLPVLIRHYLKFEATFLGFNVDHDFSGVIDGLIMVDMARTNERVGNKLLGDQVINTVRDYHFPDGIEQFDRTDHGPKHDQIAAR